ncbi:GlxA family transcriptional regulator [Actinomadura sp. WAC 06369]|uniref:GlxA family transcriptional regulator n=1 Tax=Actinomadura sp. WAC 06369 TaxID=2203193 RepID=UPI000F78C9E4|nr:helix-turn-helix domain-containing protein [Actinomadura sp. WAC 06369]RSN68367.1 AraC family transcriptional regulator [Actinomadura sp. WAC 06369]
MRAVEAHTVAVVVVPPVMAFDVTIPHMVFGAGPGYELRVCAAEPGVPLETVGGLDVVAPHGLDAAAGAGTVLVVGGGGRADVDARVLRAVRGAASAGARVAAICTGVFVLGEAGLLDGRRATTHWGLTAALAERFPAATVLPDVLYEADGPVLTSAGAAAGIELCLHIVRTDRGAAAAAEIARLTVAAPPRPGDQVQVVDDPVPAEPDASLAATRAWALERLAEPLSLADLARHARVSTRTLSRRFRAETGLSPLRWLLHRRVDRACELLETTRLPMDRLARLTGLGSADSLRAHVVRRTGVPPSEYRNRVSPSVR